MATMEVGLVSPERRLWSGEATELYARTLGGEIGILPGHVPVLGVLADGGVVKIVPAEGQTMFVAVSGGFLSVNDNKVSVLAEVAEFGDEIDIEAARTDLNAAAVGSSDALWAQGRIDAATAAGH